jgi:glycine hydroxymethyltransferase
MRETEMRRIGAWIGEVLTSPDDTALQSRVRAAVAELCQQYPAPADEV